MAVDGLGWPVRVRRAKPIYFGTRLIVCQITGKNGVDFKNYIKNRFCGGAGVPAHARRANPTYFGTRLIVCQIIGKNGVDFKKTCGVVDLRSSDALRRETEYVNAQQ